MNKSDIFPNASEAFKKMNADKLEKLARPWPGDIKADKRRITREGKVQKGPNRTEREFNRLFLDGRGIYEGITFRLPGGSRYTPDWILCEDGAVHAIEVKGSYRLPSEGRALTAFREARAAFPGIIFSWWTKLDGDHWKEKFEGTVVDVRELKARGALYFVY